jgi:polysaccharide pyruvyl transferase WcaK-like protein
VTQHIQQHTRSDGRGPRVIFLGHFGAGNWGNECTLQAAVHNVRARWPHAELLCLCTNPSDTAARHGLTAIGLVDAQRGMVAPGGVRPSRLARVRKLLSAQPRGLFDALRLLRAGDILVMTGTGMITDWGEGALGLPFSIWKWVMLGKARGLSVVFLSVGVEQITHPLARRLLTAALASADYRSFRDQHSKDQLARIGVNVAADPLVPDLAFSLPRSLLPSHARVADANEVVAVGVFSWKSRGEAGELERRLYRAYIEKLGSFVLWLLEREHPVQMLIGDVSDLPVLADLREWLSEQGVARFGAQFRAEPAPSVEQLIDQLAAVDLVVATRFHNVLLALFLGKPAISLAYEPKNDALLAQVGLGQYCQSLDAFVLEQLIEQFVELQGNAARLRPQLEAHANAFREVLDRQYTRVFGAAAPGDSV